MDPLREIAIGINFVEITLDIIIALYIFRSYLKDQLEAAGYAVLGFLSLAAMRVSYIVYDYYAALGIYLYLAWIFLCAGIVLIIVSLFILQVILIYISGIVTEQTMKMEQEWIVLIGHL